MTPDIDQLVIDIARETYDRFVMGGWEPQDMYYELREMISQAIEAGQTQ